MVDFIDIYSFIPVSGCVDMGTIALLCPGAYNVVKTALVAVHFYEWPSGILSCIFLKLSNLG